MCFVNDSDWCAEVNEESIRPAEKDVKCMECRALIPTGQVAKFLHQQEHEECQDCENGFCNCKADGDCCRCDPPNFGNVFDYICCVQCQKFLDAIEEAEHEAGCSANESRPMLGEMRDALHDAGMEEAKKYWLKARDKFPELVASGYVARLWKRLFVE